MGSNNNVVMLGLKYSLDNHQLSTRIQNYFKRLTTTMAVLHSHAIAGSLGGILTGLFAEPKLNRLFFGSSGHYIGLFYGFDDKSRIGSGVRQMGVQFIGILFVVFVNKLTTSIICILIPRGCISWWQRA